MAPPGYVPPSYVHDRIPERYMHKDPPPPGADTNGRAYLSFFSYLGLCVFLAVFVLHKLVQRYNKLARSTTARLPARKHIRLFYALAAGSLMTTWYFNAAYLRVSYKQWAMWRSYYQLDPDSMHWGLWLKETSLFREMWETVVVGNSRYWWTHQIFVFSSVLGLSLEERGVRRGISYSWAFMLLGQVVSVSFATSLYLLTLLLDPAPPSPPSTAGLYRRKWFGSWLINLLTILFTMGPTYLLADEHYWYHQQEFMPMLLTPHVALLVLPVARALLPSKYMSDSSVEFTGIVYKVLWGATLFGGGLSFARVTTLAWNYSGISGIYQQLWEHPAISSVAFDVIFCWLTWASWWTIPRAVSNGSEDVKVDGNGSTDGPEAYDFVRASVSATDDVRVRRR